VKIYYVTTETTQERVYCVEAQSEAEARKAIEDGKPFSYEYTTF